MRNHILVLLSAFSIGFGTLVMASDDPESLSSFVSGAATVSEAVQNTVETLEAQGFDIVLVIDHAANAANVKLELRPTQLIMFSKRRITARLIKRNRTLGIDFPLKILVWEDEPGDIRLTYNSSGYLAERHELKIRDRRLSRIDRTLRQFGRLDNGLITVESTQSVKDTVASLQTALSQAGFVIPLVIEYSARLSLPPTQLIVFGNPKIGTQLMQVNQAIGVDLPQKFLVWENKDGQVRVTYNDPEFLADRHNILGLDELLQNIKTGLGNLANAGANP